MIRFILITSLLFFGLTAQANAAAIIGRAAPPLALTDVNGERVRLDSFKGKIVVLEWVNFQCPFVGKHYGSGNMQVLQRKYTGNGVVWLSVCSSAPGKQGHVTGAEAKALMKEKDAAPTRFLLDPKGTVGRAYGAKTTPHMFVIDPAGKILYNGAIDDKRSARESDRKIANNYVRAALSEAVAGKPVTVASTTPYGCSIKY